MMRRLVKSGLVGALLMLAAGPAAAQEVLVGVKGGLNISDISIEDVEDATESTSGLIAGGFIRFGLGEVLALQPELLYTQKGAEAEDTAEGITANLNLDYLEVPVLLLARIPVEQSPVRPVVFAGPAVAFELTCELEGQSNGTSATADCDDAAFEDELATKSVDVGAVFGAGVDFDLSDQAVFTLEGRYTLGLTNIQDTEVEEEVKNRVLSFLAGIGFRLP